MARDAIYGLGRAFEFALIDKGATDFESTPVTFATGDAQIMQDQGSFANTTNNPAHEGNGIYSITLTDAEMRASSIVVTIIDQTATKLWEDQAIIIDTTKSGWLEASKSVIIGEVDTATFTATTTQLEGFRLSPNVTEEATADHYNGRILTFTSGALLGQQREITDYVQANSKEKFTYATLTDTPSDGDRYVIT